MFQSLDSLHECAEQSPDNVWIRETIVPDPDP
jgi:hypothetical protein